MTANPSRTETPGDPDELLGGGNVVRRYTDEFTMIYATNPDTPFNGSLPPSLQLQETDHDTPVPHNRTTLQLSTIAPRADERLPLA